MRQFGDQALRHSLIAELPSLQVVVGAAAGIWRLTLTAGLLFHCLFHDLVKVFAEVLAHFFPHLFCPARHALGVVLVQATEGARIGQGVQPVIVGSHAREPRHQALEVLPAAAGTDGDTRVADAANQEAHTAAAILTVVLVDRHDDSSSLRKRYVPGDGSGAGLAVYRVATARATRATS